MTGTPARTFQDAVVHQLIRALKKKFLSSTSLLQSLSSVRYINIESARMANYCKSIEDRDISGCDHEHGAGVRIICMDAPRGLTHAYCSV